MLRFVGLVVRFELGLEVEWVSLVLVVDMGVVGPLF